MLTKSVLAMMIGFSLTVALALVIIPWLKKIKCGQRINEYVNEKHQEKSGTPTMGGLIFIIPTLITVIILLLMNKLEWTDNLFIVLFVMCSYAVVGFVDDYLKIKRKNNSKGLTVMQKLFGQIVISLIFFLIYLNSGASPIIWIHSLGIKINVGWAYGTFILVYLVGFSNAVNLTDGLDGLAGGLSLIAFLIFGLLSWNTSWLAGNEDIAILCFILVGSLLGFLIFNTHPAKVFMGDTGSLALGAVLATIAILTSHEILLILVAGVFVIEALSVIIQVGYFKYTKKKTGTGKRVFLMAPLHHHFEKIGWCETDIVKLFWTVGILLGMISIVYGVWIPRI
jgi:phospho-N-acetylmuramoyl-pentapeptide-transferase